MQPNRKIDPLAWQHQVLTDNADVHNAVLLEQVRLLYRQAMPGFAASWFNATVLLAILFDATTPIWLLSWYGLMLLLIAGRLWLVLAFRRAAPGMEEVAAWRDRFSFSAFLAGLLWGALTLLVHDADFMYQLIVAFVIAGMTAGAAPVLAAIQATYIGFMLPAMAAMIALLLGNGLQGEPYGFALAAMSVIFALTLILAARAMERTIAESLRVRFANLALIASLQRTQQDLQRSNDGLRTSNQELEAFSYSVSHDLRAPLRAIDGFGLVLLEDYSEKLDAAGKEHLNRIRQAAQRMSILIDAMLNLARLNRGDLQPQMVNLSQLAGKVLDFLRQQDPDRAVEIHVEPGLRVWGDARLLQLVLDNLLRNAWKFSSRVVRARIEFGCVEQDGERVYFVRDNGVGFDMQYADKLFGAFQRLHGMTEFEGTGIGLATVARIINRHGGRVWAEGAVGQGATFYFTLGRGPDA